jgi:hypothetical protein
MFLIFFLYLKKNPTDSISLEKYISVCMAWENGVEDDAKKRVSLVKDTGIRKALSMLITLKIISRCQFRVSYYYY